VINKLVYYPIPVKEYCLHYHTTLLSSIEPGEAIPPEAWSWSAP
jgi:hypothetical protein